MICIIQLLVIHSFVWRRVNKYHGTELMIIIVIVWKMAVMNRKQMLVQLVYFTAHFKNGSFARQN